MMTKFIEKVPFYPYLIAIYPVVYLLAENIREINAGAGLRAALFFLTIAALAILFGCLLSHNTRKGAIIGGVMLLTFFLIFFVLYAPLYRSLREVQLAGQVLGRHRYLVPMSLILILAAGFGGFALTRRRSEKQLKGITFALNAISSVLILIPLISMLIYTGNRQFSTGMKTSELPLLADMDDSPGLKPDVYLIILDMHVSDTALKTLTGYEDIPFSNSLREKGFYIADCSRSNYPATQYSITSQLNMDYIHNLTDSTDAKVLYQLMQSSRVERTLRSLGYRTYAFETGYQFTELHGADEFLRPLGSATALLTYPGVTPFESLLLQVSGGRILYETRDQLSQKMQYLIDAAYVEYRDRILYDLETLPGIAKDAGPKFVFAHIMAPHSPFVFDREGNFVQRRTPFTLTADPEGYDFYEFSDAYYEELLYLHKRVLGVVDEILSNSQTPPVIILQGDHGMPRTAHRNAQYEIYFAIYMADKSSEALYSTLSPVNSFRVIFNDLFGTDYPLLPDETYYFDDEQGEYLQFSGTFTCP